MINQNQQYNTVNCRYKYILKSRVTFSWRFVTETQMYLISEISFGPSEIE